MAFELDYAYNKEDVDVFTITAPESVSGVSGRIAGDSEATLALQYDDLVLDDARPVRPGMTPADAVFGVVCALRDTSADESWRESADGTALTVLHYRSEKPSKNWSGCARTTCSRSMPSFSRTERAS